MWVRVIAALISSAAAAWPQSPPAQGQPEISSQEAPVTFSSRVNLVSVPVVVRDREGHAVGNLRREDFQLFDKGKLQTITKFTVEKSEVRTAAPESQGGPSRRTVAPVPSEADLPERYIAYLVDDIHLTAGVLLNTREAMKRHLDASLDGSSRAAIFTTSGIVLADFTNDREKLRKAVDRILPWTAVSESVCPEISYYMADAVTNRSLSLSGYNAGPAVGGSASKGGGGSQTNVQPDAFGIMGDLIQIAVDFCGAKRPTMPQTMMAVREIVHRIVNQGERETELSFGAVSDVIRKLSSMPGSRNLVLVSPGFIVTTTLRLAESDVFETAIRANIAINTIDMRGVYTLVEDASLRLAHQSAYKIAEKEEQADTLAELADNTGGKFIHDDNDLKGGLDQLAARPEFIYVLGFSPQNLKLDGRYHGLKVTVRNVSSPTIQARRGYWAPNHAIDAAEAAKEELREDVFSREEIHDIPVDLHTEFFKSSEDKAELTVTAFLNPDNLRFQKAAERNNDTVTVVTGVFDGNGNYVAGIQRVVQLHLRDQTLTALRNAGISVEERFSVPPGRYVVRLVVQDAGGQTTATRNEGVEIP
jgi:VWFA-related protein